MTETPGDMADATLSDCCWLFFGRLLSAKLTGSNGSAAKEAACPLIGRSPNSTFDLAAAERSRQDEWNSSFAASLGSATHPPSSHRPILEDERTSLVRTLLQTQLTASLGTLHGGKPAVSMVPFALLPSSNALVIHVSRLATHTKDMEAEPAVSVLVVADRRADVLPQALPRLSIAGMARPCSPDATEYDAARAAYLARFPESEPMFGFGDFSLFLIEPTSVRVVGGFAQAWSLTRSQYLETMTASEGTAEPPR